jgi:hypothetical protein
MKHFVFNFCFFHFSSKVFDAVVVDVVVDVDVVDVADVVDVDVVPCSTLKGVVLNCR